jgi:hypothetical protein
MVTPVSSPHQAPPDIATHLVAVIRLTGTSITHSAWPGASANELLDVVLIQPVVVKVVARPSRQPSTDAYFATGSQLTSDRT